MQMQGIIEKQEFSQNQIFEHSAPYIYLHFEKNSDDLTFSKGEVVVLNEGKISKFTTESTKWDGVILEDVKASDTLVNTLVLGVVYKSKLVFGSDITAEIKNKLQDMSRSLWINTIG